MEKSDSTGNSEASQIEAPTATGEASKSVAKATKGAFKRYKFKVDCWRFHVSYGIRMVAYYLAVNAVILTIMFSGRISAGLFCLTGAIAITISVFACIVQWLHLSAVKELSQEMKTLADEAGFSNKSNEGDKYVRFVMLGFAFYIVVILAMLLILVYCDPQQNIGESASPVLPSFFGGK